MVLFGLIPAAWFSWTADLGTLWVFMARRSTSTRTPDDDDRGRFSTKRKTGTVLRLFRAHARLQRGAAS